MHLSGPHSIQAVKIAVSGVTAASGAAGVLDQVWIRIYWDRQASPAVYAPLGSFFALGQGLVAGMDAGNTMYMYLPMPFRRSATIQDR